MLHFNLSITNPFKKEYASFNEWFCKDFKITKNKYFSIQLDKPDWKVIFSIGFSIRDGSQDHKGVTLDIACPLFTLIFDFYDNRHSDQYGGGGGIGPY